MLPSVLPRLAKDPAGRVFPGVWKPLFLRLPSQDGIPFPGRSSLPTSFVSFFFFYIFSFLFWRQWSAFLGAWSPLPAFRNCFVEFAQRWKVLLMNFWGRKWSPHPIPPPSSSVSLVMLLKFHLTSHSEISDYRWVTTPKSLSSSSRSFLCSSSVYFCHIYLISSASVKRLLYLSFIMPILTRNVSFISPAFLKRSLVFPFLWFSSISLHCSLKKVFLSPLAILWFSRSWVSDTFSVCFQHPCKGVERAYLD